MTTTTFASLIDAQVRHMAHAARRLDEKGYIIFVHGLNSYGERPDMPYRYFNGAVEALFKSWAGATRRKVALLHVFPVVPPSPNMAPSVISHPMKGPLRFTCDLPRSRHIAPIVRALELTASVQKGRNSKIKTGRGALQCTQLSDRFEFAGTGRDALELVIRVLEMPPHRDLLMRGS